MRRREVLEWSAAGLASLWMPGCSGKAAAPAPQDLGPTASVRTKIFARGTTDGDGATLALFIRLGR